MQEKDIVDQAKNDIIFKNCLGDQNNTIDLIELRKSLENGADPNYSHLHNLFNVDHSQNSSYYPLLHVIAGKNNSVEAAEILLMYGADLCECDTYVQNTPLLSAIAKKDYELTLFYINTALKYPEFYTVINQKDKSRYCGNTPLILAFKSRFPDHVLEQLIHAGASPNTPNRHGLTPLHYACLFRKNNLIQLLLDKNADINLKDNFGFTPGEYYVYQIGLQDLIDPIQIGTKSIMNFRQLDDMRYHVGINHAVFIESVLIDFFKTRNATPTDIELINVLNVKNKNSQSLNKQHYELQSKQLKLLQERLHLLLAGSQEHKNLSAIIDDELLWLKNYKSTDEYNELQKSIKASRSIQDEVIDHTFAIIESIQTYMPYQDEDYAKREASKVFKQIRTNKDDVEIVQTIHSLEQINSFSQSSLFKHINAIKLIQIEHEKETNQVLDEQIKAGGYSSALLTTEFESALEEIGYGQYQELKQQIRSLADNIWQSIVSAQNGSYRDDCKDTKKLISASMQFFKPKFNWKVTADILQSILNKNSNVEIITELAILYNKKDEKDFFTYLDFTLTDTISQLEHISRNKLGKLLIKDYILVLNGEPRKYEDQEFVSNSNLKIA